ncbi:MAG: hypothetical protein KF774_16950, partial [Planctomyces sp.]|nr:hypothetical protein [Planctomyces sp.]
NAIQSLEGSMPGHWSTFNAKSLLGAALLGAGDLEASDVHLLEGFNGMIGLASEMGVEDRIWIERNIEWLATVREKKGDSVEAANWREKLEAFRSAKIVAPELRKQAALLARGGQTSEAIAMYEKAAAIPGESLDHAAVWELYARTMQWEKAVESCRLSTPAHWKGLHLYYETKAYEELRVHFQSRLRDVQMMFDPRASWMPREFVRIAGFAPLEEGDRDAVRRLAEFVASREGVPMWQLMDVGGAMYRLGEFEAWWDSLPAGSGLRAGDVNALIVAILRFQKLQDRESRELLESRIRGLEGICRADAARGDLGPNWHSYIRHMAWIREGRRVLEGGAPEVGVSRVME